VKVNSAMFSFMKWMPSERYDFQHQNLSAKYGLHCHAHVNGFVPFHFKACASLEEGYLPPLTFVVVQKRHHTRLFPEVHGRHDMTDKSGNILPG
jgi:hypothetical protein